MKKPSFSDAFPMVSASKPPWHRGIPWHPLGILSLCAFVDVVLHGSAGNLQHLLQAAIPAEDAGGPSNGPHGRGDHGAMGPWKLMGNLWEIHGKSMGNPWENGNLHNSWENNKNK